MQAPTHLAARAGVVARWVVCLLAIMLLAAADEPQDPQEQDLVDRPISAIRFEGLVRVPEQLVRNNIRSSVGDPFDSEAARMDVRLLERLGEFKFIDAQAQLQPDGTVVLVYAVVEQPLIAEVQVVGNRLITDQELLGVVSLIPEGPRDDFQIERAKRAIEALYRQKGHYLTTVNVDERELTETGILIFQIIEGPRVRVTAIEFDGNGAFSDKQLRAEIKTRTAFPLFRRGELDTEVLADDVAALDRYYKNRGYLDVRVDRRIDLSPDNREAKITFLIIEGELFTLRSVEAVASDGSPLVVFSSEQIAALLELKVGDAYSADKLGRSLRVVRESYQMLGYLDVRVQDPPYASRPSDRPEVKLVLEIDEGRQFRVGIIDIQGNFLTKDKVIRRELRLRPGRPFDATEIGRATDALRRSRLFSDARITIQQPEPDDPYRDVLVQIKETNTGSVNFGLAFGSDSGAAGEFSIVQRNFDIADTPESFNELIRGRAFRGAGQRFSMTLRPGNEIFQYLVSLTEPNIFETDYSLTGSFNFRQRIFSDYDEERLATGLTLARRLGDVWALSFRSRAERVKLTDIDADAPTEVFEDAGPDNLNTLGITLTRTTIRTITRPGRGSRLELSFDQTGLVGGDFEFSTAEAEYTVFLTLDEDFLGRKTTLRLNTRVGYIFGPDRAPTYEQFYLGGRTFRGFDFREISPKGIRNDTGGPSDDPVGGEWLIFAGAQYEFPLVQETITGVFFVDSGTVTDEVGVDPYRVSVGTGVRLYLSALGPVPIAFDFGFPVVSEDTDDEQVFSFTADLPF
jgi:outer membrane protein insertion porin family